MIVIDNVGPVLEVKGEVKGTVKIAFDELLRRPIFLRRGEGDETARDSLK